MPRVARANKQKNKKFKGSKPAKKAMVKKASSKTKAIAKSKQPKKTAKLQRIKEEATRKEREAERITSVNEYLDASTKGAVADRIKAQN